MRAGQVQRLELLGQSVTKQLVPGCSIALLPSHTSALHRDPRLPGLVQPAAPPDRAAQARYQTVTGVRDSFPRRGDDWKPAVQHLAPLDPGEQ